METEVIMTSQNSIFRFIVDDEDTFSCGNCYEMQYGTCKGNPQAKPCRKYASRNPTCISCLHFVNDGCRYDESAEPNKPFCDYWNPKHT